VDCEVVFPEFKRAVEEAFVERAKEFGLADHYAVGNGGMERTEIDFEIDRRSELAEIGEGHFVVVGFGVAQLFDFAAEGSHVGLEFYDSFSFCIGLALAATEEAEERGHIVFESGARLLAVFVGVKIKSAFGQGESALRKKSGVPAAVFVVGRHIKNRRERQRRCCADRPLRG